MGKMIECVCGCLFDYSSLPDYSEKMQRPGRYCPDCKHPADLETAEQDMAPPGIVENVKAMHAKAEKQENGEQENDASSD